MIVRAAALALLPGLIVAGAVAEPHAGGAVPLRPPPAPIDRAVWEPRTGDIIVTAAQDLVGDRIRNASGADAIYSHVGIVVTRGDGTAAVLEVSPMGSGYVDYTDVAKFTTDPATTDLLVLRPRTQFDVAGLNAEAERLAAARVAFDYDFDMADPRRLYCAELVHNLLRNAGVDLRGVAWTEMYLPFVGERNLVTPDALARATSLEQVVRRR